MQNFADKYREMKNFEKLVFHAGDIECPSNVRRHEGYYTECGKYKPWSQATVRAAERRGLITVLRYLSNVNIFYVRCTAEGMELYKELIA